MKLLTGLFAFLLVFGMMAVFAAAPTFAGENAADCNTGGHANPATYDAVYAGTDDCGRTNGAATVNSPAELPEDHPIGQVTFE